MRNRRPDQQAARTLTTAGELRTLVGKLKRRLREKACVEGLSLSQLSVLGHLEREGPATVTELARAEHVRPQSMGATVATLQNTGLVSSAADPGDGRRTILSLTAEARRIIQRTRAAREDWLCHTIRTRFTPEEQEALARGVALLKRLVDD